MVYKAVIACTTIDYFQFPLKACLVFSSTMEARLKAGGFQGGHLNVWIMSPKCEVSSAILSQIQPLKYKGATQVQAIFPRE